MLRIQMIGLAIVAAFAFSVLASASASAACTGAELPCFHGPFPIHFTAEQLGTGKLVTVGKRTIECTGGSTLGFINGPKDALVNAITYTGCKSTKFGSGKCKTPSAEAGEIISLPLLGLLGYINKTTKLVGLLFEADKGGTHFASFECESFLGTENVTVEGTVICDLSPVTTITKKYHLLCEQANGMPTWLSFEGAGTKDHLISTGGPAEPFGPEESGVTALSDVLTLSLTLILA
jgi:hypothetical protein